jgi:hypothetical protein
VYDTSHRFVEWIEYNYPVDDCISSNSEDETDVVAAQHLRSYARNADYPHNVLLQANSPIQRRIRALYLSDTGAQVDRRKGSQGQPDDIPGDKTAKADGEAK